MQKKGEISEYREKLDKTLSSPELTDHESLKSLLRNQLSGSSPGMFFFCLLLLFMNPLLEFRFMFGVIVL